MENMRGRGRGRRGRGRGRRPGGATGRRKKSLDKDENSYQEEEDQVMEHMPVEEQMPPKIDLEADISQLEAPTFTTISRGPPEPMLRLPWGHPVNLLGEKVMNPMIHCCDQCLRPVLIYGRMIPCKHVFCLACAKRETKICPRCHEKVSRVEQTGLGTVFMCTHGGSRYGNNGCRRTYLSQRDLQAHINHRHVTAPGIESLNQFSSTTAKVNELRTKLPTSVPSPSTFYEKTKMYDDTDSIAYSSPRPTDIAPVPQAPVPRPVAPPPTAPRSNLITVPIQEPPPQSNPYYPSYNSGYYAPPMYQDFSIPPTDTSVPPPAQPWPSNPPFYGQ